MEIGQFSLELHRWNKGRKPFHTKKSDFIEKRSLVYITVDSGPTQALRASTPHSWKSTQNIWLPQNSMTAISQSLWGTDRSQDTPLKWTPKSGDAQVLYTKWRRTVHTGGLLHPWIPNWKLKMLFSVSGWLNPWMRNPGTWGTNCILIDKFRRTSGSTQLILCCSRVNCLHLVSARKFLQPLSTKTQKNNNFNEIGFSSFPS